MKLLKIVLLFSVLLGSGFSSWSQTNDTKDAQSTQIFTPKDRDFLQLWYHDQVKKMDLDEDGRDDYAAIVTYHTYKMTRLSLPQYNYTDAEQKEEFDKLTEKLNVEAAAFLSPENYAIHKESITIIVDKVYKQKGWE